VWKYLSSGMFWLVVWYNYSDVSEAPTDFVISTAMGVLSTSETSVDFYQATRGDILKHSFLSIDSVFGFSEIQAVVVH
jgi:hypothetical protein